jgi:hypothetical protein
MNDTVIMTSDDLSQKVEYGHQTIIAMILVDYQV